MDRRRVWGARALPPSPLRTADGKMVNKYANKQKKNHNQPKPIATKILRAISIANGFMVFNLRYERESER